MLTPHYLGGESRHRALLGGNISPGRRIGLLVWFVAMCILSVSMGWIGLCISGLLLVIILWATMTRGRDSRWRVWRDDVGWRKRERTGMTKFRPAHTKPAGVDLTPVEAAAYREWPEGVEGMYWLRDGVGPAGIAWHVPPDGDEYLSVVWRVQGAVQGIEGDDFVNRFTRSSAALAAETAQPNSLVSEIQYVTRCTRIDMGPHEWWVLEEVDNEAPQALLDSYGQLVGQIERSGLTQEHFFVAKWPITSRFKDRAEARGPAQQGWISLMDSEIDRLTRSLRRARQGRVDVLSAREVLACIRHLQLPSWASSDVRGLDPDNVGEAYDEFERYVRVSGVAPDGEFDSWLHRTAEIPVNNLEAASYDALWLMPLLAGMPEQIHRTISTHITTTSAGDARRAARRDLASDQAEMREQRRKGILVDETVSVSHEAAKVRHRDLRPGSGVQGAGWAMHITISARDTRSLRSARDIINGAASQAGISKLEWLDEHQGAAQSWTWPVARGMDRLSSGAAARILQALRDDEGDDL